MKNVILAICAVLSTSTFASQVGLDCKQALIDAALPHAQAELGLGFELIVPDFQDPAPVSYSLYNVEAVSTTELGKVLANYEVGEDETCRATFQGRVQP